MPLGVFQVMNGYLPRAMWPTANQIKGYAAWGGVAATGALFVIQPWDFLAVTLGLKKAEE